MITDKMVEAAQDAYQSHVAENCVEGSTEAIRAALEAAEAAAWQPIETAPKDGSWVMTSRGGSQASIASWRQPRAQLDGFRANGGHHAWVSSNLTHMVAVPTHWRPLPTAPEASE